MFSSPKPIANGSYSSGLSCTCHSSWLHKVPSYEPLSIPHPNLPNGLHEVPVSSALLGGENKARIAQAARLLVLKPSHLLAKPVTATTAMSEQEPGMAPGQTTTHQSIRGQRRSEIVFPAPVWEFVPITALILHYFNYVLMPTCPHIHKKQVLF